MHSLHLAAHALRRFGSSNALRNAFRCWENAVHMPWLRLWNDMLDDPRVQKMPAPLFKSWVNFLCVASRFGGIFPCIPDIAFCVRLPEAQVKSDLDALTAIGLIDVLPDGMSPHNWKQRQPKSDRDETNAQRQAAYRQRKMASDRGDSNALRNGATTGYVTRTETETETETELNIPPSAVAQTRETPVQTTPIKSTRAKPTPKSKGEQPSEAGFELLTAILDETHAELRGDARRREAIQADALLRRTGGDAAEALAYVRYRLASGQSPALQWAARDYAPGWHARANGSRASPNGTGKSTLAEMLAQTDQESEEERVRGARRINDQAVAAGAAVLWPG